MIDRSKHEEDKKKKLVQLKDVQRTIARIKSDLGYRIDTLTPSAVRWQMHADNLTKVVMDHSIAAQAGHETAALDPKVADAQRLEQSAWTDFCNDFNALIHELQIVASDFRGQSIDRRQAN